MMTIRQALHTYSQRKMNCINVGRKKHEMEELSFDNIINTTGLCVIIPLHNGVNMFFDLHPEVPSIRKEFPDECPNKNGIFRRLTFEIDDESNPIFPDSIRQYVNESSCNGVSYYIDRAKERAVNEFISYNGGIDEEDYERRLNELFSEEE